MVKSNCKDCQERFLGCHNTCEKYKKFRKKLDYENSERRKFREYSTSSGWDYTPRKWRHKNAER